MSIATPNQLLNNSQEISNEEQLNAQRIESINRRNRFVSQAAEWIAMLVIAAIVVSIVWLVGSGLYQIASVMMSWDISRIQQLAIGY